MPVGGGVLHIAATGAAGGQSMQSTAPALPARVWDRFVRFFHWSLVTCVLANYFLVDDGETLHHWIGYFASVLIVARIVWGFVGSEYARFTSFFPTPARLRAHLAAIRSGQPGFHPGHNPLGAVMMLALMVLVLALGLSGFLQTTDAFWGEEWLQEVHEMLASALIALATLHAAAAIIMGRLEGVSLVGAMITGVKRARRTAPGASASASGPAATGLRRS
jgi:cytochrome b